MRLKELPHSRKNNSITRTLRSILYFKLFELVVVIMVLGSLYTVMMDRVVDIESNYESAEISWTIAALRSAASAEAALLYVRGAEAGRLEGGVAGRSRNPMRLLSHLPYNYIGELCDPDVRKLERGSWYFDQCNNWLVYVLSEEKNFASGYPKILKFNVESFRLLTDPAKPS